MILYYSQRQQVDHLRIETLEMHIASIYGTSQYGPFTV